MSYITCNYRPRRRRGLIYWPRCVSYFSVRRSQKAATLFSAAGRKYMLFGRRAEKILSFGKIT